MMDHDSQLKVQACLDGELAPQEVSPFQAWLANEPEAQALLAELRMTATVLAGFETGVKLPESPEFFWSKVQREIQRQPKPVAASRRAAFLGSWRRWLVPAGALAAAMAAVLLSASSGRVPEVETSLADSGAFTYYDFGARTTLVWLSYPADDGQSAQPDALE
jgi:anti-sigma factor RsiW